MSVGFEAPQKKQNNYFIISLIIKCSYDWTDSYYEKCQPQMTDREKKFVMEKLPHL